MNDPNRPPVTGHPVAGPLPSPNGYPSQPPPSGTAYPYAAAPPPSGAAAYYYNNNNNNPYYHQPNNPYYAATDRRTTFLRRVITIAIASMVIVGVFIFIVWLVLRPKLPEFRVDSLSVSNLNLNNSSITANFDLRFIVRNPNKKMTIYYDDVAAAVFYDGVSLSDTTTAQKASFATSRAYVDSRAYEEMNRERSSKGVIGFNVRMVARVRFKAGAWRARRRFVRVYCKDLSVGVPTNKSSGNLLGGSRQCRVGL
ncbi:unnamed protein product [Withania somnifera]